MVLKLTFRKKHWGPGEEIGTQAGWTPTDMYLNLTNYSGNITSYEVEKT
ncbi:MAG: hypothetical protein V4615_13855 [Bacteroidota bacterium]